MTRIFKEQLSIVIKTNWSILLIRNSIGGNVIQYSIYDDKKGIPVNTGYFYPTQKYSQWSDAEQVAIKKYEEIQKKLS